MPVKLSIKKNWVIEPVDNVNVGLLKIVVDGHRRSNILAPKDTSAMVNSSKIESVTDGYKVTYGSDKVPYARKQFYENKTKSHYLTKAFDAIMRSDISKYFRGS